MNREGKRSWGEIHGNPDGFANFASRCFLEDILPQLRFPNDHPEALELGCGTGPGACYLAAGGFRVTGIDLIPTAIKVAREIAAELNLDVHCEVLDVTKLPHDGTRYDLIVDSYCLQGIVLDADRRSVFAAVRAMMKPSGYYLISTSMVEDSRHHPEDRISDPKSRTVFHRYDDHDLFDPESEILYALLPDTGLDHGPGAYEEAVRIRECWFLPKRRYRSPESFREELEAAGFSVLLQSGRLGQNVVCALPGSTGSLR